MAKKREKKKKTLLPSHYVLCEHITLRKKITRRKEREKKGGKGLFFISNTIIIPRGQEIGGRKGVVLTLIFTLPGKRRGKNAFTESGRGGVRRGEGNRFTFTYF